MRKICTYYFIEHKDLYEIFNKRQNPKKKIAIQFGGSYGTFHSKHIWQAQAENKS
jgi:hypothetical protein